MSTTSRPRMKFQAVTDKCHVEIVGLKGTYVRNAGIKSAAILDGCPRLAAPQKILDAGSMHRSTKSTILTGE